MKRGWMIAGCIAFGALFLILLGVVTMVLWNWLVPVLFAGPIIDFWQALGLLVLSKILFSGFGKGHWNHRSNAGNGYWKSKFYDKFSNMTPEERDALKQKMKEKWCSRPGATEANNS